MEIPRRQFDFDEDRQAKLTKITLPDGVRFNPGDKYLLRGPDDILFEVICDEISPSANYVKLSAPTFTRPGWYAIETVRSMFIERLNPDAYRGWETHILY